MRGFLTEESKKLSIRFLGRLITQKELRLYPYLSYISINNGELEIPRMDVDELNIINVLDKEGHIKMAGMVKVVFSKDFYMFMQKILYLTYVKYRKEDFAELWELAE